MSDEETYVGLFAYGDDTLEETDWDQDPETVFLGEGNDLPAMWQVQFAHAAGKNPEEVEYLTENDPDYEGTTQAQLDTGIQIEEPEPVNAQISDYNDPARTASD